MNKTDDSVDEFLASIDADEGEAMRLLDARICAALPGISRVLWRGVFWGGTEQSIIGYGDLVQERPKGPPVEWFLLGLALQKNHISVYVNAHDEGGNLAKQHAPALKAPGGRAIKAGPASLAIRSLADLNLEEFDRMLANARAIWGV